MFLFSLLGFCLFFPLVEPLFLPCLPVQLLARERIAGSQFALNSAAQI